MESVNMCPRARGSNELTRARATKKGGVNLPVLVNLLSVIQHGRGREWENRL